MFQEENNETHGAFILQMDYYILVLLIKSQNYNYLFKTITDIFNFYISKHKSYFLTCLCKFTETVAYN